jgi:hypothetical protein
LTQPFLRLKFLTTYMRPRFVLRGGSPLNWNKWIRQTHRWLSVAFTLVVVFDGVAVFKHRYTNWMGLLAVATLALMFFTGMYLFVLPYVTKWWHSPDN